MKSLHLATSPQLLHPALHRSGEVKLRKTEELREKNGNPKSAAQTAEEAGATPPRDAPCVSGLRGVAPASWRQNVLRQWFGPRAESEFANHS